MDVCWIGEPETGVSVEEMGGNSVNAIRLPRLLNGREINDKEIIFLNGFAVNGELQEEFLKATNKHGGQFCACRENELPEGVKK